MSYTKHNWSAGDIITASKLEEIENAIEAITDEVEGARNYDSGTSGTLGSRIDELVQISSSAPNGNNEIWVSSNPSDIEEFSVPTYAEFQNTDTNVNNFSTTSFTADKLITGWENNGFAFGNGNSANSNGRIRTPKYIDKNIKYLKVDTTTETEIQFAVFAYDNNNIYKGAWRYSNSTTPPSSSLSGEGGEWSWWSEVNLADIGDYNFKLVIREFAPTKNNSIDVSYAHLLICYTDMQQEVAKINESINDINEDINDINGDIDNLNSNLTDTNAIFSFVNKLKGSLITDQIATAGVDLNDATYRQSGQWRISGGSAGNNLINKPDGYSGTGLLIVQETHYLNSASNACYQILMQNDDTGIWIRRIRYDGTKWNYDSWKRIDRNEEVIEARNAYSNTQVYTSLKNFITEELSVRKNIDTTGIDINDCVKPGSYVVGSKDIAKDTINWPDRTGNSNTSGNLLVFSGLSSSINAYYDEITQIVVLRNNNTYIRVKKNTTTWTEWILLAKSTDIAAIQAILSSTLNLQASKVPYLSEIVSSAFYLSDDQFCIGGQWRINSAAVVSLIQDLPGNYQGTGILATQETHFSNNVSNGCYQILFAHDVEKGIWFRRIRKTTSQKYVDSWNQIADQATVDKLLTAHNLIAKDYQLLVENDDLNDAKFLVAGEWRIPTTAIGKSLLNKPVQLDFSGILTIQETHYLTTQSNYVYQTIYSNRSTNIWTRLVQKADGSSRPNNIFFPWERLNNGAAEYSWQSKDFIVHKPAEESFYMLNEIKAVLNKKLSNTSDFSRDPDTTDNDPNAMNIMSKDIYDLWDHLVELYPDYISKENLIYIDNNNVQHLAKSRDIVGSTDTQWTTTTLNNAYQDYDNTTYDQVISAYYIHPKLSVDLQGTAYDITFGPNPSYADSAALKYAAYDPNTPTIYITAGVHGGERLTAWILYTIFERAFQTGNIYTDLLDGVQYRIVPVLDCWAYDHASRMLAPAYYNDSSVAKGYQPRSYLVTGATNEGFNETAEIFNANRQCKVNNGEVQFDIYATEAQALINYMRKYHFAENNKDIYIDMHHNTTTLGYCEPGSFEIAYLFNKMINRLNLDWSHNSVYYNAGLTVSGNVIAEKIDYYTNSPSGATNGKRLCRMYDEKAYAWYFGTEYTDSEGVKKTPYASTLIEMQQTDGTTASSYAVAKCMDISYRWFKTLYDQVHV